MDSEVENAILENIQDYIFDENKILTCKWLSTTHSVPIHIIRQLIHRFIQKHPNIFKTYYISGITKNGTGLVSTIVREEDLGSFKDNLNQVFSEHLYSIQKNGELKDLSLLYTANQQDDVCKGIIKNSSISKRNPDELASLRLGGYPAPSNSKTAPVNQSKPATNNKPINNMFSNNKTQQVKKDLEVKKEVVEDRPKADASNSSKQAKRPAGIAGFFAKQSANCKPKLDSIKTESKPIEANHKIKEEKQSPIKKSIVKEERVSPVKSPPKVEAKKVKVEEVNKKAKTNVIKKKESSKKDSGKKRKRIQIIDSDSDTETNEVDVDDIFSSNSPEHVEKPELSDDEDVIPPTPEVKINKASLNPRKRKKVVDKTFLDENGYIITKKEEVFESCSEDEKDEKIENVPLNNVKSEPKQQIKKTIVKSPVKGKKKTSPTQGHGKQQSLMSFFKKVPK